MSETQTVTNRRVLGLALPIVLSNATVPLLGAVDTGVVGQMGEAAPIGAVGVGAIILTGIYWMFGFLRMGTTGLASQARGAGDQQEVAVLLTRALLIAGAAGGLIIVMQPLLFWGAFKLSPASVAVEALARDYMQIRIFSAPAAIAIYGLTGWLVALERARSMFVLQIWMNGINIVLDIWFVLGLGWGVQGVAFATFLAEWSALFFGLYLCREGFQGAAWRQWSQVFDAARLRNMVGVNSAILLRSTLLQAIFLSFLLLGARFGDDVLAANQVLLQFLYIAAYGMDGFAFASEALVGQYMGARNRALLRRSAILCAAWCGGIGIVAACFIAGFGGYFIDLMATSPEVREQARIYLMFVVLAPIVGFPAWILDGIFIGATAARDMRNMMVLSSIVYLVVLLSLLPLIHNFGLWISLLISFIARGVTLGVLYPRLERRAGE